MTVALTWLQLCRPSSIVLHIHHWLWTRIFFSTGYCFFLYWEQRPRQELHVRQRCQRWYLVACGRWIFIFFLKFTGTNSLPISCRVLPRWGRPLPSTHAPSRRADMWGVYLCNRIDTPRPPRCRSRRLTKCLLIVKHFVPRCFTSSVSDILCFLSRNVTLKTALWHPPLACSLCVYGATFNWPWRRVLTAEDVILLHHACQSILIKIRVSIIKENWLELNARCPCYWKLY